MAPACAVVYNTLDGMHGYGLPGMRARPDQWTALFAMESGAYYPQIYDAKARHGINLTAGARTG